MKSQYLMIVTETKIKSNYIVTYFKDDEGLIKPIFDCAITYLN